jgi:gliding motility-associated protein GldE
LDPEPPSFIELFQNIDSNLLFGTIGIFVLLFISALLSGAEVAFFSLSPKTLDDLSKADSSKGKLILLLVEKPKKLLATLLVANNFINIGVVILFSFISASLFSAIDSELIKFILEVIVVTFLILLFGEVIPKVYANRNNLKFAEFVAHPLYILDKLLTPISAPMRALTIYLHEKLGKQKAYFTVDQLSQALELTSSEGSSHGEQKILEGIVTFGNTDTKQVMSPRIDVFAIEITETFDKILPKIIEKGYSRIPVYHDNIDHIEGVLFVKDLIPHIDKTDFDWKTLLRKPFFVPENKKLDDLLKDFQSIRAGLNSVQRSY